tara:strand:+ start:170 stop:475 length:306 start_codon:yes stop_codon:yes gene_type:complete
MKKNYEVRLQNPKKYKLNHYRMFVVKYLGATEQKGSRVKINDTRRAESVTISFDYRMDTIRDIAIQYLLNKKIKIEGFTTADGLYYLMTSDFETSLKEDRR